MQGGGQIQVHTRRELKTPVDVVELGGAQQHPQRHVGVRRRRRTPGGGGYGDPLTRDASAVLEDVRLGRYTEAEARALFAVVLQSKPLMVDEAGTLRARGERLASGKN